jgi:pilus assembly protein CpaF
LSLKDRLNNNNGNTPPPPPGPAVPSLTLIRQKREVRESPEAAAFRELKNDVHNHLLKTIELAKLEALDPSQINSRLTTVVNEHLDQEGRLVSDRDRARLIEEVQNEILGLGPLEPLLRDDSVNDILVNGSRHVYVERNGRLYPTDVTFRDDEHLLNVIGRIVGAIGRRIDEASPMVDARLPDGSRVNAIIPPLALDGPILSIRRFGRKRLVMDDLIQNRTLTPEMAEILRAFVRGRLNILISGGTGSGKTTLLNCLTSFIPADERIVTIEDSAELQLQQTHVVRLETRPPNLEGRGEVTQRDLVRNTLRMRPDRIIVGEVREPEVFEMLQAMSTGHDGSLGTIHANNPREGLGRLEMMMMFGGFQLPDKAMRQQISSAINVFVHLSRMSDGARKVTKISEITGMEGETVIMQDLYDFVRTGTSPEGKVLGNFRPSGIRSNYAEKIEGAGMRFDPRWYSV